MERRAQPFPHFDDSMPFSSLLYQIELHIVRTVDSPYTYEQLRGPPFSSHLIRPLVKSLEQTRHPAIIAALLAARLDFSVQEDDRAIHEARAFTAELVALRLAAHMPENELIQYVTYEIPRKPSIRPTSQSSTPSSTSVNTLSAVESTPLLADHNASEQASYSVRQSTAEIDLERQASSDTPFLTESAVGLSALELAILGDAKKFLLSRPVEQIITSIWEGRIVFWESISIQSTKRAKIYNPRKAGNDWYSRLRVPKYRSFFMMLNYASLLAFYYAVLTERNITHITVLEILLDIWYAGFVYEEIGQVRESGSIRFYVSDYWSMFDLAMIAVFLAFFVVRLISVFPFRERYAHAAFDILALEALMLVPRVFSNLSITPYFGTLLPCLKQMTKDFMKFLVLIVILYVGFLTTFSFLGRDHFTVNQMAWLLIRVFFGAPYDGLDASSLISPIFGPTLMLIFVILTNVLLITVVISILSQRFGKMMNNANEEYMLLFSSSVLESITTSDRVTYFYPPLNLIGIIIRPLRLFLNHSEYRNLRIYILKITHAPFVAILYVYENFKYLYASQQTETRKSLLHLRGSNAKKRLWGSQLDSAGGGIAQGILVSNQAVMGSVIPNGNFPAMESSSSFNRSGNVKSSGSTTRSERNRSKGLGGKKSVTLDEASDVVRRRKTRKAAVVAQPIKVSGTANSTATDSNPLSTSLGERDMRDELPSSNLIHGDGSTLPLERTTSKLRRARTSSMVSSASRASARRSKLAIALLRDLRKSHTLSLLDDDISEAGSDTIVKGAKAALASDALSDHTSERVPMSALSLQAARTHDYSSVIDDEEEEDNSDDDGEIESEQAIEEDADDDDDDDDDFLSLYTDQTTVRIRGLEEQVFKMSEMIEHMTKIIENMDRKNVEIEAANGKRA
ncbi:uncharacterized protein V1516DRAFT_620666 [Lipomyces oligophaga]|uniref:uncharacterized protein n=1 Tax=Lipomyces oligophaga TaxID=45792 RepID=UPI0034CDA00D